ncbi:MAG TPA: cytochrome C oxidase subunit IV family protein [Bacteroidota bacterium]|nr:cytochrome C oxidase subunit IV family protein [Bacteroidota bacterium]
MDQTQTIDFKKHVRTYIAVFVALMALTVVTVAVSYLHLPITAAVVVALIIAGVKGSLVASYFMHLISERKLIYWTLALTFIFFLALMLLPLGSESDKIVN